MGRPKDHRNYPAVFREALDILRRKTTFEVKFSELKDARTFRMDYYAYLGAAAKDPDMLLDSEGGYPFLMQIAIQVKDDPPRVIIMKRNDTPIAQTVQAAVEAEEERYRKDLDHVEKLLVQHAHLSKDEAEKKIYRDHYFRTATSSEFEAILQELKNQGRYKT